jgi:hypothetical protein
MIDDDFNKMVRHMFEHFFKDAFGPNSHRAGMIRFGIQPSEVEKETGIDVPRGKEIIVEKFDFENNLLIIIEGYSGIDELTVEAIDKTIVVDDGSNKEYIEIPISVNVEESGYSFRNGILEIVLQKIKDNIQTEVKTSGLLKIES